MTEYTLTYSTEILLNVEAETEEEARKLGLQRLTKKSGGYLDNDFEAIAEANDIHVEGPILEHIEVVND